MIKSNKGRFKCPHEAQAVWNFFTLEYKDVLSEFENDAQLFDMLTDTAHNLHKARLIHGTIYDEDGLIEDKDVALQIDIVFEREYDDWPSYNLLIDHMFESGKIRGTIFY